MQYTWQLALVLVPVYFIKHSVSCYIYYIQTHCLSYVQPTGCTTFVANIWTKIIVLLKALKFGFPSTS